MKFKSTLLYAVFFATFCCFANLSFGDSVSVGIENDVFLHDDSDYSHGTQIKYTSTKNVGWFDGWGIDILQNMYTPGDIKSPDIQFGDRPYCGLLLASVFGDKTFNFKFGDLNLRNELGIGSTGRDSFAQDSQKIVHKIIGSKDPKGWDHQVAEEFIVQYQGYADLNIPVVNSKYFTLYGIPRASTFVGNFKDSVAAGLDLKLGGPKAPKQNYGGEIAFSAPSGISNFFGLSLLAGVEGKCVFWDASLDGTMFRESEYTIDSEMFVGELHGGVSLAIGPVDFNFLTIFRTKEYKGQDESPDYCRFSVTFNF